MGGEGLADTDRGEEDHRGVRQGVRGEEEVLGEFELFESPF